MRLLDLTLPNPAQNLALDEALLIAAEERAGGEVIRLWELATPAVILGAGGSMAIDVNAAACEADRIPILRRASGGGTVVVGPGCVCFSLVLAYVRAAGLEEIARSNRYVLGKVLAALGPIVPTAALLGTSDLVLDTAGAVKFSGNSQQRKRRHFLHHGTVLCKFDLELIPRYLKAPERQPVYRHNRGHREFVANSNANIASVKAMLAREWDAASEYTPVPCDLVDRLIDEKYSRDEWNRRR